MLFENKFLNETKNHTPAPFKLNGRHGRRRSWIYNYLCNQCLYHQWSCEFQSSSGDVYSIQHVIKFVSHLPQVGSFLRAARSPSPKKTYRHDITEIVLKVALNTIYHWPNMNQTWQESFLDGPYS